MACNKCGVSFCEFCINNSLLFGNFCPYCKTQPFQKTPTKAFLRKFLNRIRIKCIHPQCKERIDYFNYLSHIQNCSFRLYHCDNEGCNFHDTLDNIKIHSNECKFRIINCKYCQEKIKEYNFETHVNNSCSQLINCPRCKMSMTRGFYNSYHKSDTNENVICLQNQLKKQNDLVTEMKNKEVELNKIIKLLKENIKKERLEKKSLQNELSEWQNSIKNVYDNLILKKQKSERLNTYTKNSEQEFNNFFN